VILGVSDDLGAHSSLTTARSDLASVTHAVAGLRSTMDGLESALSSVRGQSSALASENAALSSQNAAISSQNSALIAQAAARASAPIFAKAGAGGISPDASLGFVVTKSGPYLVQYAFNGCSNDSPLMFLVHNNETNEYLDVAPNASGKQNGGTAVYLVAGNWFLFGGGQLVGNGQYDPGCRWTLAIAPNS
jgi:hypothetical protein